MSDSLSVYQREEPIQLVNIFMQDSSTNSVLLFFAFNFEMSAVPPERGVPCGHVMARGQKSIHGHVRRRGAASAP